MKPFCQDGQVTLYHGDCLSVLRGMEAGSVQTCVTSPPYFGLRDYGDPGQIGLEPTPAEYVAKLVEVFREVRRVLADDGTVWLNLGDSYASAWACSRRNVIGNGSLENGKREARPDRLVNGLKEKDRIGIPHMAVFALRADGWYWRDEIVWYKRNPMPESVEDRTTKAHEIIFLLSKRERYYYDAEAIAEPAATAGKMNLGFQPHRALAMGRQPSGNEATGGKDKVRPDERNRRSVWDVPVMPFPGAHFATFPPKLIEPCVLAGSKAGDTVLDPFNGAGTSGLVATQNGRRYVGIDLNAEYLSMTVQRLAQRSLPFTEELT